MWVLFERRGTYRFNLDRHIQGIQIRMYLGSAELTPLLFLYASKLNPEAPLGCLFKYPFKKKVEKGQS